MTDPLISNRMELRVNMGLGCQWFWERL